MSALILLEQEIRELKSTDHKESVRPKSSLVQNPQRGVDQ
jgi:hypothetical protein